MKAPLRTAMIATSAAGLLLAACTAAPAMRKEVAQRIASPSWMIERTINAGSFSLTAFERMHERFQPADVYIEGDGVTAPKKNGFGGGLFRDPTPENPVALHLASRDKAENVVWIARPCQYAGSKECDESYWQSKRFAPEVLQAYSDALDDIKRRYDIEGFNLVGFSGGGTIASILAATRNDIISLRTVAGNLDHRTYTAAHGIPPLDGSLNPPEFSDKLAAVPQIHFIGGQDEEIPPAVLHSYLQAVGPSNCVQYQFIQVPSHEEGWVDKWPDLLKIKPACEGPPPNLDFEYDLPEPQVYHTIPEKPEKP